MGSELRELRADNARLREENSRLTAALGRAMAFIVDMSKPEPNKTAREIDDWFERMVVSFTTDPSALHAHALWRALWATWIAVHERVKHQSECAADVANVFCLDCAALATIETKAHDAVESLLAGAKEGGKGMRSS